MKVAIIVTTGGPDNDERLDAVVCGAGGRFLDAPVLGGPAAIESGKLVILAGGDAADIDAARGADGAGRDPARRQRGLGRQVKLVANSMLAAINARHR